MIKLLFIKLLFFIGKTFSFILNPKLISIFGSIRKYISNGYWLRDIRSIGASSSIQPPYDKLYGLKYFEIGNKVNIGQRACLMAWDKGGTIPSVIIGDGTAIGDDFFLSCSKRIEIGREVLFGRKITIVDNSHGDNTFYQLVVPPIFRPITSKGPIYIGDRVWIGDKVTILPNVSIGEGSIVGANSVVTRDIPSYCIACGNPARVIRTIKK
ncbi:MAG: acyltransferase [Bacteroidales bacterium]|nr:acyltransferase [Bacteroidales bacterium]